MPKSSPVTIVLRLAVVAISLALASLGFAQKGVVVLGKLGQSMKAASIFSKARTNSRVYFRVRPYDYLVIQPSSSSSWFKVLLQNGRWGYIRSEAVARLPYEVTCDASGKQRATDVASRGGSNRQVAQGDAGSMVAGMSQNYIGAPYKWGGTNPNSGIDCSALVKLLYGQVGVNLPRTAAQQAMVGQPITRFEDLRAGDRLYFWSKSRGKIGHTGVYLGNTFFTHSSSSNGGVTTSYLGDPQWRNTLVAARR